MPAFSQYSAATLLFVWIIDVSPPVGFAGVRSDIASQSVKDPALVDLRFNSNDQFLELSFSSQETANDSDVGEGLDPVMAIFCGNVAVLANNVCRIA